MQGKGAKKKVKLNTGEKELRKYSKESKEAINPNYYVMAKMRAEMEESDMIKAKIIDCRLRKDAPIEQHLRTKDSYDYYLHFCSFDRRMDRWIPPEWIIPTKDYIEPETKKKKDGGKGGKDEHEEDDEHEGMELNERLAHEEATKLKTIFKLKFGKYYAETWYYSPFPEEYHDIETIYFCEFCLAFFAKETELKRHIEKCNLVHPPGNQVYSDTERQVSLWEVDVTKNTAYCENLAFLSKLFLDHKLLTYPIDPFLFFILCESDQYGHHIVGYFSKNKYFANSYNLSCILTLPFYQRKGYGKFLISLSYELSRIENKIGTPERPLSDLGRQSYLAWWTQRIIDHIREKQAKGESFSLDEMSKETFVRVEDIIESLENVKLLRKYNGEIYLCSDPKILDQIYSSFGRPALKVKTENLHWVPYLDPAKDIPK